MKTIAAIFSPTKERARFWSYASPGFIILAGALKLVAPSSLTTILLILATVVAVGVTTYYTLVVKIMALRFRMFLTGRSAMLVGLLYIFILIMLASIFFRFESLDALGAYIELGS